MSITKEKICLYSSIPGNSSSFFDIIHSAHELSLGGVELMNFCEELKTPDMAAAKRLGNEARSYGLNLPCFSVGVDMLEESQKAIEYLCRYAEICSELEIPYLHHTIALSIHAYDITEEEREDRFLRCSEYAIEVSRYAKRLGVRTLIEDQGFVFNGTKNCLRFCEMSNGEIGIVADVGNIMFFDELPQDFIRAMGGRICHAHIKDYLLTDSPQKNSYKTRLSRYLTDVEIGKGSVSFEKVKKAFEDVSYDGMYSLEFSGVKDISEVHRVINRLTEK